MNDYRKIAASIYSNQTEKTKRIIDRIRKETEKLTVDELGILSILFNIDKMIREEEENGKIVKFPSDVNL